MIGGNCIHNLRLPVAIKIRLLYLKFKVISLLEVKASTINRSRNCPIRINQDSLGVKLLLLIDS